MSNEERLNQLIEELGAIIKDLGVATAYGYAVEKGYEGTEEEFAELMADYAHVAQDAEAAAQAAAESATAAHNSEVNAAASEGEAEQAKLDAQASAQAADVSEANAKISELNADTHAENAEAIAVGTRGGVPVGQGDPAYHNNAKYYAELADTKADQAADSADTAATKAGEASTSAATAGQKATEASASAADADASKTAAKTSEDNAKASETTASNAAVSAMNSRDSAAGSATTASNAASTATQKATEAGQSATSAAGSASTATQKATEASQSATSASGSASTATQKATEASNSANAAAQSAADAAESATHVADMALMQAIAPKYDSTAQYKVGILLTDSGKLYYCKKNAPAGTPVTNTEYFRDASVAGDFISIIKVTDQGITLGDINTILNGTGGINPQGLHIMFDVGALGASMYLCTIFIDADAGVYKIFDIVLGRVAEGTYSSTKLLSMAIANADTIATQSQINDLQAQVNELGGKSLIKDWDTLGEQIKAGTSQNYIHIGDTVEVNWNKTVLGVTTPSSLTVTCTDRQTFIQKMGEAEAKDYLFVYDGANWTYNESAVVLSEYGLSITGAPVTGEVMTITTTVEKVSYTFVSYDTAEPTDSELAHNWLLEQTYAPTARVFDTYESLFNLAQGNTLTAGAYKLTAYSWQSGANVTVYFNVPADITATGGDIQFASQGYQNVSGYIPSEIRPVYKGSTTYLANSISITKTEIAGATDVSTVTGVSVGVIDQATFGDNDWGYSNLRAFLNNTQAGNHYEPSWAFDRPSSYSTGDGFLYCIDPRVLALIQACNVKCTAGYGHEDHTRNSTYTVSDKVFLLSMKEMSFNINTEEGTLTQLYGSYTNNTLTNDAVASRAKYNKAGGTLNSYRWSRSAVTYLANLAWSVTSSGSSDGNGAVLGVYVAPAFIIGKI